MSLAKRIELKIPPLLVALCFALFMFVVDRLFPGARFSSGLALAAAALVFSVALSILVAAVLAFRKAQTTVNPGKPEQTSFIVSGGIYRVSRNPMYLGFLLVLIAWALYLANIAAAVLPLLFILYMNLFQIAAEEKILAGKFGKGYEEYSRSTRRWI
jgi:protein-S-isoprenylcysteine O-methyltransferase Ste14